MAVFEILAIIVSTAILKKVGSHPAAFGKLRNYVIKYGPRAIRGAKVSIDTVNKKATKKRAESVKKTDLNSSEK